MRACAPAIPVEVEEVASLADSLGGGIGMANRLTFAMCRDLLDEVVLVTEDEIYHAMQVLYYEDRIVAEGACVVGLAAVLNGKVTPRPDSHHHHRAQSGHGDVHPHRDRAGRASGRHGYRGEALWRMTSGS